MRNPHNPDPLHEPEDDALWDPQAAAWVPRPSGLIALLVGLALGLVIGFLVAVSVVRAAPRSSVQPVIPAAAPSMESEAASRAPASSGNLAERSSGAPTLLSADAPPSGGRNLPLGAPLPSEPIVTEPPAIASGLASWYDDGPGLYGAVPSWRFGDRPYQVRVSAGGRSVVVTVRDFCGCPGARIIDLSPSAFRELAPLARGVIPVTIEDLAAPGLTPPPTDVSGG
jgi:rare lipoprotein A (peptidoglycan hydrolase)